MSSQGKMQRLGTMGLLFRGGKVLLIKRRAKAGVNGEVLSPESWAFPGGAVDPGETPEVAVVREFQEEVGLAVRLFPVGDDVVWGQVDDYLSDFWRCIFFVVEALDPAAEPQIMEPHKHLQLRWMDWQELWLELSAVDKRGEYFQSLVNMVDRYPLRANL
ncbi:hypothetical protein KXX35_009502, partial [Aspergillus fumigatus]